MEVSLDILLPDSKQIDSIDLPSIDPILEIDEELEPKIIEIRNDDEI